MTETPQQAYISKVHLKGYKSIRDLEIDFKPGLNIIIGPNGSGKTNFLEFVYESQVSTTYPSLIKEEFYSDIYINQRKCVFVEGKFKQKGNNIFFEIREKGFSEKEELEQERLILHDINKNEAKIGFVKDDSENPLSLFNGAAMKPFFSGVNFIRFSSRYEIERGISFDLHKDAKTDKLFPLSSMENPYELFMLLYDSLMKINVDDINRIKDKILIDDNNLVQTLRKFTPISDLSLDNDSILIQPNNGNNFKVSNVNFKFLVNNKWLYWNQLSDGTKRLFYIISKIITDNDDYYFLEEPELGIHPDQLYKLMDFLKEQSKEKQIIITTHSPDVLNILGADELDRIIVTKNDNEKGTIMRKLQLPQIEKARRYMESAGLFLSDYWVHSDLEAAAYETEEKD